MQEQTSEPNIVSLPNSQPVASLITTGQTFKVDGCIDAQIMTAKAFPRNIKQCLDNTFLTMEFTPDIAESCYYTLPRKGGVFTGPSVRLAEILSSFWGNLQAGTRFVSNTGKTVIAEGWAWDLETNWKVTCEVSKSILTREGTLYSSDGSVARLTQIV